MPGKSVTPSARHRAWIADLPEVQEECAARWQLALGTGYQGRPPSPFLAHEITARSLWNGNGVVRLAAADLDLGALLLERAEPGLPLASLCADRDVEATAAAALVIRARRYVPASRASGLPCVAEWITGLERVPSAVPSELGHAAREALREGSTRLDTNAPPLVLHGDLHHGNLPSAERIRVLAEAVRLDPTMVRAWGCVLAVIAAWWSFEDGERDWAPWLACAAAIQRSG